ncbi:MAG: lipid-A-disaccharide synthase [Deltaproteobacteria bacterium]|nr:lipid-A-disaccharide synthase [Deltaproteobacteria bacterium]
MLVVGEASGDLHGARLAHALVERDPALEIFGVAGERLRGEGVRVLFDVARLTGMGLTELAGSLTTLWTAYRLIGGALREEKPDLLILIDFPEFNLRLARIAKGLGIPVLYYIGPQIWAWRPRRVKQIARRVDRMAVVFPFEVSIYEREGVEVSFVGHPLLDAVCPTQSREATLKQHGLDLSKSTIALLPGSRRREVAYHLPVMLEAAERLCHGMDVQFILARASTVERDEIRRFLARSSIQVAIAEGNAYDVLNACDFVWAASGTATLETALLLKPMVIMYRLAWLTYGLARLLVRVDHIGMVNILAGEKVVPELIQEEVTAERIVRETTRIMHESSVYHDTVAKLAAVRQKLGAPGAADRVAEIALEMMGKN